MILAILDDLMFSSKIRATAAQMGVTVSFARSRDAALEAMAALGDSPPTLVILDLNNPRTEPLAIVAAMLEDPVLQSVPTLGFASHVQADVIEAARKAGVTQVVARSAFAQHLPELLASET
jgi:PleD family two-component response regulator